jgi:uncharacterized membrane protein YbhN (UPF0104 family)
VKIPSFPWGLRLLVSVLLLGLLLWLIPLHELAQAVGRVSPALWIAVLGAFLVAHVASAAKWRLLVLADPGPPPRSWITAHFAGLTANLFLPGIAGGDVVRAGYLMREGATTEHAAAAGLADRLIDVVALLLVGAAGAVMTQQSDARAGRVLGIVAGALALGGLAGIVMLFVLSRRGFGGIVGRLTGALRNLAAKPARLGVCLASSVSIQGVLILLNSFLGRAVGVEVPFSAWCTAWPMAKLVALAPVSLAGLGVREAALVAFMQPFGAAAGPVMAAGLLWESVLVSGGAVGWLMTMSKPAVDRAMATRRPAP